MENTAGLPLIHESGGGEVLHVTGRISNHSVPSCMQSQSPVSSITEGVVICLVISMKT